MSFHSLSHVFLFLTQFLFARHSCLREFCCPRRLCHPPSLSLYFHIFIPTLSWMTSHSCSRYLSYTTHTAAHIQPYSTCMRLACKGSVRRTWKTMRGSDRADTVTHGGVSFVKSHGFAHRNIRWSMAVITRGEPAHPAKGERVISPAKAQHAAQSLVSTYNIQDHPCIH